MDMFTNSKSSEAQWIRIHLIGWVRMGNVQLISSMTNRSYRLESERDSEKKTHARACRRILRALGHGRV